MPEVKGKITQTTIGAENWDTPSNPGKALFCIYVDNLPPVPDQTKYRRVAITSANPAFAQIVETALSAQSSGATITLTYLESHVTRANSWDFGVLNVIS